LQKSKKLSILAFAIFLISPLQAMDITNQGEKSGTKTVRSSVENLIDIEKQLASEDGSDLVSIYQPKTTDIRFPEEGTLEWNTGKVLEIQTAGNIIFPKGFSIRYIGEGGGLIVKPYERFEIHNFYGNPKGGTIIFEGSGTQIDFSKSKRGAISLFYNPHANPDKVYPNRGWHKYHNSIGSFHVLFGEETYFSSFMLINTSQDLQDICYNPKQSYALSKCLKVNTGSSPGKDSIGNYYENKEGRISGKFKGIMNYNGFYLSPIRITLRGTVADEIFENALLKQDIWGTPFIFMVPPLYGNFKRLINLIFAMNEEEAVKLISDSEGRGEMFGISIAYISGIEGQTPLHLAARFGLTKLVQAICENVSLNNMYFDFGISSFNFISKYDSSRKFALSLAAEYGHLETVRYLVGLYKEQSKVYPMQLIEQTLARQQTNENYQQVIECVKQQEDRPQLFTPFWLGIPNGNEAQRVEYEHAQKAHSRFFFRNLGTARTGNLYNKFTAEYEAKKKSILNLEGVPSRSRILLFKAVTDYKLKKIPLSFDTAVPIKEGTNEYWSYSTQYTDTNVAYLYMCDQLPTCYLFGGLPHTFTLQSTRNKPGYTHYKEIGKYEDKSNKNAEDNINRKISEIFKSLEPKKVFEVMRQSHASGQPITTQQLFRAGYKNMDTLQPDAEYLNRVNFLMDLEVASRLVRGNNGEATDYDLLAIGVSWARTQALLIDEVVPYADLGCFIKTSKYHLFTGDPASIRELAIKCVSNNMNDFLKQKRNQDESNAALIRWEEEHPEGVIITTQEKFHQELLEEYGGGYESEGEAY